MNPKQILYKLKTKDLILYGFLAFTLLMGTAAGNYRFLKNYIHYYGYFIHLVVFSAAIYFYLKNDITSYLKLTVFTIFIPDYINHYIILILTIILFNKEVLWAQHSFIKIIYVFLGWCIISYAINLFREPNFLSLPLFVFTFFTPFIFFILIYNRAERKVLNDLYNFLLKLLFIISLIVLVFIIFFWNLHPDIRTGGTGSTHSTAVFFIFGTALILYKNFKPNKIISLSHLEKYLVIALPILLFFLDAKYIMVWLILSLTLTLIFFYNQLKYKITIASLLILIFLGWYNFTDRQLYLSDLAIKTKAFGYDNVNEIFWKSAKGELIEKAVKLPITEPLIALTGYGPGTFLSFAGNLRDNDYRTNSYRQFGAKIVLVKDLFTIFLPEYKSKVKGKYFDEFNYDFMRYSSFFDWRSSMLAIFYETGIVGFILFISIFIYLFLVGFKHYKINHNGLIVIFLSIFLFLMSFNELWYEYTHYTIFVYGLLASIFISQNQKSNVADIESTNN